MFFFPRKKIRTVHLKLTPSLIHGFDAHPVDFKSKKTHLVLVDTFLTGETGVVLRFVILIVVLRVVGFFVGEVVFLLEK